MTELLNRRNRLYYLRVAGSHDKTIRVWTFNENYMKNLNLNDKTDEEMAAIKSDNNVVTFMHQINHHKHDIIAIKYDGKNCIISADING